MKFFSKQITKTISAIFLGVILALGASYVSALTSRPSDINTNAPDALDISSTPQTKGDPAVSSGGQLSLKQFLAGFISSTSCSGDDATDYTFIDDSGSMAVGRCTVGSGITLDIKGKTGVKGTIRAMRLAHTEDAKVPVCAGLAGELELCGENLEYNPVQDSNGDYESGTYSLVIPDGVTSLSVSILGAGGAGYGENNKDTYADDGDASFFAGENVYLFAEGGQGADSFITAAAGGDAESTPSSTNSRVSILSLHDGGNGEAVDTTYTGSSSIIKTDTCSSTTYYAVQGGTGDTGGKGGASYIGSQVSGGTGSSGGPTSGNYNGAVWGFVLGGVDSGGTYVDCNLIETNSDAYHNTGDQNNRMGGDGTDAGLGDGGSGFGGHGGASALTDDSTCSNFANPFVCTGSYGGPGGGAGAYITATVNVNEGEIFYIKVGRGGVPQYTACTGSSPHLCQQSKDAGGGAVSGQGGNGKVTVQFDYTS